MDNHDIYEYLFDETLKNRIIGDTASVSQTDVIDDCENDNIESKRLFDVSGDNFAAQKVIVEEKYYWVEICVLKIIMNLLKRYGIKYHEIYYPGNNEQHSICIEQNGRVAECYFLYDVFYGENNRTDYDEIAQKLYSNKSSGVDVVKIYIFRDDITMFDLAALTYSNVEKDNNLKVDINPLRVFFEEYFDEHEYECFIEYVDDFNDKARNHIGYRTVIVPSPEMMINFKDRKARVLETYKFNENMLERVSKEDIQRLDYNFKNRKMYQALVSEQDFSNSFISSEWAYDMFSSFMGELDLTGIASGYLKSIEQLLFYLLKQHKGEAGRKVNVYDENGKKKLQDLLISTEDERIESTLGALQTFFEHNRDLFDVGKKTKGFITDSISDWRAKNRNGYFHKDNLHDPGVLTEIRERTIFLYYLILGGVKITDEQRIQIGIVDEANDSISNSFNVRYNIFTEWIKNIIRYDVPLNGDGMMFMMVAQEYYNRWLVVPYRIKSPSIEDFMDIKKCWNKIVTDHTADMPPLHWRMTDIKTAKEADKEFQKMLFKFMGDHPEEAEKLRDNSSIYYHGITTNTIIGNNK